MGKRPGRQAGKIGWRWTKTGAKEAWQTPAKTYKAGRRMGLGRGAALGEALKRTTSPRRLWRRWKPPLPGRPAGPKLKAQTMAAGQGLKKAAQEIWGAAIGRKVKTWRCNECGNEGIPTSQKICPDCDAMRGGRRRGQQPAPRTPRSPTTPRVPQQGTPPPAGHIERPSGLVVPSTPSRAKKEPRSFSEIEGSQTPPPTTSTTPRTKPESRFKNVRDLKKRGEDKKEKRKKE